MKPLAYKDKLADYYLTALTDKQPFVIPWWIWLAPCLLLIVMFVLSSNSLIAELLLLATRCAALPALLIAIISWLLSPRLTLVHKVSNSFTIALVYGSLVAINVYFLYGPYMSRLLLHADAVDELIFFILLVAFSCNLGLASVLSLSLIYYKNHK